MRDHSAGVTDVARRVRECKIAWEEVSYSDAVAIQGNTSNNLERFRLSDDYYRLYVAILANLLRRKERPAVVGTHRL